MHECKLCNASFKYLAHHLKTKHLVTDLPKYYCDYILKSNPPICNKCGNPTNFRSVTRGFAKTCSSSCANSVRAKEFRKNEWADPVKRRKRSIVSRKAGKKVLSKRWKNPLIAAEMIKRTFPKWGNKKSRVPRQHSKSDFGEFLLRSKNELNFVNALLRLKQHVLKVEYEKTVIPYYSSSQRKSRYYIPDFKIFWIDGKIDLVEIKPESEKSDPIVIDKQKEAIRYCSKNGLTYFMISPKEYQGYIESRISSSS